MLLIDTKMNIVLMGFGFCIHDNPYDRVTWADATCNA